MPKATTIAELRKALSARIERLRKLQAQRRRIAASLAALDREIAGLAGRAVRKRKKKARKTAKKKTRKTAKKRAVGKAGGRAKQRPLVAYLSQVLGKARGSMRAKDVAGAVLKAGYKTKDKGFKGTVSNTLARERQFK
ncbi:MAG: hypothetical protein ACYS8K_11315, partial [Planctomycetota bacterium]